MAYGVLYEFRRTSTNGADILITISQRDYEGEVKKRSLGRAPVIKRENNGHIYGTSCELYAECLVDGEFSQLYTSDAYEFRVEVYRNDSLLWMGFVSPELYSEPDVAPPYDVQIIATDGLGELKNFKFEKRGVASMLSHVNYLMGKTGIGMALNIVSELRYVDDAGVASADKGVLDFKINLDHEEGSTCYDVLQNLMSSVNANITQYNGRYLIFRETDFINKATEEGVEGFDINGSAVSLPVASFGSMNQHKWWPVGQLSTVIDPAKNEVVLRAPDYYKDNVLDFDDWALANAASFNEEEGAYILPDEGSNISQYVDFGGVDVGYRLGLRVKARNVGITETDQNIGIRVEINGRAWAESLGTQFWLRKSGGASTGHPLSDYAWNTKEDFVEEELRMPTDADTSADAQNVDIVIPLYDNANDVLGTFVYANDIKITIFNPAGIHDIYVYDVSLVKYEQIEGYEADVVINNAAREEEGEVELTMSAGDLAPAAGKVFMTGIPLLPSGSDPIKQWQVGNGNHQDYLSVMAYDYSRAIALPKMKYAGVLNVPGETVSVPLLFLRDGTYYFPKTYSYDIYNDELELELISISAADVSLTSVIISQMAQSSGNMGGLTTSGSGGGGVVSLPRDKEMSDTSDNAVENRVIKAYVDGEIEDVMNTLASMWYIEDNNLCTDKQVYIKNNLIVSGDTSSGGSGEDTPASGTVTGIKVSASDTLYPNTAGVIDMVDTLASIDVSDQLTAYAKTADVNSALALKQDTISDLATIRSGAALGATALQSITKSMVDSVLGGASGVGENKFLMWTGSISVWSAVTKSMVATALGASTGGRYLIDTGGDVSWANVPTSLPASDVYAWAKKSSLALEDVPDLSSKYLPLSGGTIKDASGTPLTLDTSSSLVGVHLRVQGSIKAQVGWDANNGVYLYNNGTGEQLSLAPSGGAKFYTNSKFETLIHSGNIGSQSVNYATSAGSATKLATARTIWGQSFDGTGNVSGNITLGKAIGANLNDTWTDNNGNTHPWYGLDFTHIGTWITLSSYFGLVLKAAGGGIYLNSSGNVTIGGSDLAGSDSINPRLYISGNTRLAGSLYFNDGSYISYVNIHLPSNDGSNSFNIYGSGNLMLASFYSDGKTILGRQGNVGIGTSSPAYKLDVNGTFNSNALRTDSTTKAFWGHSDYYGILSWDTTYASVMAKSGLALRLGVGVTPYITIASNGAVTMSSTLSVGGNITASSGYVSSNGFNAQSGTSAGKGYGFSLDPNNYGLTQETTATGARVQIAGNEGVRVKTASGYGLYPATNNACTLGTSSYQWSHLYAVGATFSGDVTINGNLIVKGDTSSGGAGQSASVNGPVNISVGALFNMGYAQNVTQATMDSHGLTMTVVNNILSGLYTKAVDISGSYNNVWSYDGYETGSYIYVFFRQGDGFDIHNGVSLSYNKSTATWNVSTGEI